MIISQPKVAFIATILSFGISYSSFIISGLIASILTTPLGYNPIDYYPFILLILTIIIQQILVKRLFKIKRFKNGMPFLFSSTFVNIATIICLIVFSLLVYRPQTMPNIITMAITVVIFLISMPILIHWWQAQLTKSYKHSLQLRELESLRIELQEKDKQLAEISAKNELLGRVIHEDTKIIRTFVTGIEDYVNTDFTDGGAFHAKGNALLEVAHAHADERTKTLQSISHKQYKHHETEFESLNLQLNHFEKRAVAENVTFHVHIACDLDKYIPKVISPTDLDHLLLNLLDNAFVATSYTKERIIQLQFYEVNQRFVIEIADSGIPFEVDSIVNYGLTQLTTHEADGGSGIGLLKIWEIKEKHGATLHIEEYKIPAPYSKKISLFFNHKNQYSVRTWRKEDIQQASKRIDLQIYDVE